MVFGDFLDGLGPEDIVCDLMAPLCVPVSGMQSARQKIPINFF